MQLQTYSINWTVLSYVYGSLLLNGDCDWLISANDLNEINAKDCLK